MAQPTADQAGRRGEHAVHLYGTDDDLVHVAGEKLREALGTGAAAVLIATEAHGRAFEEHLAAAGLDPEAARADGRLVTLDAAATLDRFAADGALDLAGLFAHFGPILEAAGSGGRPVWIFGEMVALLWEAGDVLGAIELEAAWDELAERTGCAIFCAYSNALVSGDEHGPARKRMCALHSSVVPPAPTAATWDFEPAASSVAEARRRVADLLARNGRHGRQLEDARMVVTELAANAVIHARSPFSVGIELDGPMVRIRVHDGSRTPPATRDPGPDTPSGRGLRLVGALARRWGVDRDDAGKWVWAELER